MPARSKRWTPTAICGRILTTGRGTRLTRCSGLLRTDCVPRSPQLAELAGHRHRAGELAYKPASVPWVFAPFGRVGCIASPQVRQLAVLANDGCCRTHCGRTDGSDRRCGAGVVTLEPYRSRRDGTNSRIARRLPLLGLRAGISHRDMHRVALMPGWTGFAALLSSGGQVDISAGVLALLRGV